MKLFLIALVCLVGCQHKEPKAALEVNDVPWRTGPNAADKVTAASEKIELLRSMAKQRGIRWNIFCVPKTESSPQHYQADGFQPSDKDERNRYAEDGALDWWAETADTPEDAAAQLADAIQHSAPDLKAEHKPTPIKDGDCNYNTVFDSKHNGPVPCPKRGRP